VIHLHFPFSSLPLPNSVVEDESVPHPFSLPSINSFSFPLFFSAVAEDVDNDKPAPLASPSFLFFSFPPVLPDQEDRPPFPLFLPVVEDQEIEVEGMAAAPFPFPPPFPLPASFPVLEGQATFSPTQVEKWPSRRLPSPPSSPRFAGLGVDPLFFFFFSPFPPIEKAGKPSPLFFPSYVSFFSAGEETGFFSGGGQCTLFSPSPLFPFSVIRNRRPLFFMKLIRRVRKRASSTLFFFSSVWSPAPEYSFFVQAEEGAFSFLASAQIMQLPSFSRRKRLRVFFFPWALPLICEALFFPPYHVVERVASLPFPPSSTLYIVESLSL